MRPPLEIPVPAAWLSIVEGLREQPWAIPGGLDAPDFEPEVRAILQRMRRREVELLLVRAVEDRTFEELAARRRPRVTRERVQQLIDQAVRRAVSETSSAFSPIDAWFAEGICRPDWPLVVSEDRLPWVRLALRLAAVAAGVHRVLRHVEGDLWHATPESHWLETLERARAAFDTPAYLTPEVFTARTGLVLSPTLLHSTHGTLVLTAEGRVGRRTWTPGARLEALCRRLAEAGHRRWHRRQLHDLLTGLTDRPGPLTNTAALLNQSLRVVMAGRRGCYRLAEDTEVLPEDLEGLRFDARKPVRDAFLHEVAAMRAQREAARVREREAARAAARQRRMEQAAARQRSAEERAATRQRAAEERAAARRRAAARIFRGARLKAQIEELLRRAPTPLAVVDLETLLPQGTSLALLRKVVEVWPLRVAPGILALPGRRYRLSRGIEAWILDRLDKGYRASLDDLHAAADGAGIPRGSVLGTCGLSDKLTWRPEKRFVYRAAPEGGRNHMPEAMRARGRRRADRAEARQRR